MSDREALVALMNKKSERAFTSAKALLAMGDTEGACNRAYYAMLDAARAALLHARCIESLEDVRTHSGLINAVSNHFVKSGLVPKETGRLFKRAEELRLIADYKGEAIEEVDAQEMLQQTEVFVDAMRSMHPIESETPDEKSATCGNCHSEPCVCAKGSASGAMPQA